ncbi:hypothetical protein Moror_9263 [Moniliophthora roreri MCA 2997]|uniref:Uncharacterized protein n=1 Tax=Moniliophthora roreri (strain MCA 2997) TaxID=1381753 RepID=V2WDL6_MONRO|nr:hypothetical protein Moror_9263 [Moniliophthora roreri MCA 2997]
MAFHGSSNFTVQDGRFTNVEGNLNLVQYVDRQRRERTIWNEYKRVRTGKIHIKRTVGSTDVRGNYPRGNYRSWRNVNARRTINIASIQGEDKDSEFLCITYSGPDASRAFHWDFEQFSRERNVNVAQLFGYNDGQFSLPALIFYKALVPVAHIFERNHFSSLLQTYFHYLCGAVQIGNNVMDLCELWICPRTGTLCTGPYVQYSSTTSRYSATSLITGNEHPFLPLQTYSNSNMLFSYLTQTLSPQNIIQGIAWSCNSTFEWVTNENAVFLPSCLPGMVYSRIHLGIIAQWPGDMREWYYEQQILVGLPDEMQDSWVHMSDKSIRITVMPSDIQHLQDQVLYIYYDLCPAQEWWDFADSWISQAHSVFSQCGSQDSLEDYCILNGFWLGLQCKSDQQTFTDGNILTNEPFYLFIQPIPHPSDGETIWNTWVQRPKYLWSFDASGHKEIPEDIQFSLGLPSFTSELAVVHNFWDQIGYDAIQQLQMLNGFNSTTTDFAQSLGHQILEVIGDRAHFEEVEESFQDLEAMDIDVDDEIIASISKLAIDSNEDAMEVD